MAMSLKGLNTFPAFFPIPKLNCHIITSRQYKRLCWVDNDGTNVIWVRFESCDLLGSVVVEYP